MKIATYKDGSRDGQLLVVSRDLTMAHYATGIAGRLQQLLDDWNFLSPQLEELSQALNHGKARHAFTFDPRQCMAPLPRTGYLALAEPWSSVEPEPQSVRLERGDELLGAHDRVPQPTPVAAGGAAAEPTDGYAELYCRGRIALISADLAAGTGGAEAVAAIRLFSLACSWHGPDAPGHSIGVSFAPVAATPDELGTAWKPGHIDIQLEIRRDGKRFGQSTTAAANASAIGDVLAECVRQRGLRHGAIVGIAFPPFEAGRENNHASGHQGLRLNVDAADGQSLFGAIEPASAAAT